VSNWEQASRKENKGMRSEDLMPKQTSHSLLAERGANPQ